MATPKIKVVKVEVHDMDAEELCKAKKGQKKVRMYFSPKGENVLENLVARKIRPKVLYRQVFDEVFEKAGIEKPTVITWDPYAGCASCPCSPGFVLDGVYNKNIYVTYEGAQVSEEVTPAFEEFKKGLEALKSEEPKKSIRDAKGRFLPKPKPEEVAA